MQTGNLTFEPGSKYSWSTNKVIGQLQIPNYLIRKQPAKLGKLACVQINGMYPTTTFFCRVLTIFQSQETQERHYEARNEKSKSFAALLPAQSALKLTKLQETHSERNKLVNFFTRAEDFIYKLGFTLIQSSNLL